MAMEGGGVPQRDFAEETGLTDGGEVGEEMCSEVVAVDLDWAARWEGRVR